MRLFTLLILAPLLSGQSRTQVPNAGDDVRVDPVTADLVVKGGGKELRIQRRTHASPEFSSQYSRTSNGVRYSYGLTNGKDAKQFIHLFAMDIRNLPIIARNAPPYWWYIGAGDPTVTDLNDPSITVVLWGRRAADHDERGKLGPGQTAGPFVLESAALPGLIKVYVEGFKPSPAVGASSEEAKLAEFSPWVQEQANQLLRFPINAVPCYAIGPKIPASGDRLSNVKAELAFAAQLPPFVAVRAALTQMLDLGSVSAVKGALSRLNGTPVQKSFFDAMVFALDY